MFIDTERQRLKSDKTEVFIDIERQRLKINKTEVFIDNLMLKDRQRQQTECYWYSVKGTVSQEKFSN